MFMWAFAPKHCSEPKDEAVLLVRLLDEQLLRKLKVEIPEAKQLAGTAEILILIILIKPIFLQMLC